MEREDFCKRLAQLRMRKGVSARDMSLSIRQSPNYINGIEGGKTYPSMGTFFWFFFLPYTANFRFALLANPTRVTVIMDNIFYSKSSVLIFYCLIFLQWIPY